MELTDTKYYTPDIEDLFVGYECEMDWASMAGGRFNWLRTTIGVQDLGGILSFINCKTIRTPYLTKEDIEKEGWIDEGLSVINVKGGVENPWSFRKGNYIAAFWEDAKKLAIIVRDPSLIEEGKGFPTYPMHTFVGDCKSINEFRKITKWLNIC